MRRSAIQCVEKKNMIRFTRYVKTPRSEMEFGEIRKKKPREGIFPEKREILNLWGGEKNRTEIRI